MRKTLIAVLVGLGVFGLLAAGLFRFYVPSRVEKTPLNLDITQVATGPAKLFNAETGKVEDVPLRAVRKVLTDSAASDSKVTVIEESLCVVKDVDNPPMPCVDSHDAQHRLLDQTTDRVAADRKSAESSNDPRYATNINGDTSATHTGLTYKWPFHAKKVSYKFFDPISRQAPDARFIGTDKIHGMTMYKYEAVIPTLDLPIGKDIPGTYSDTRTVWIEPLTGVIVKGIEVQKRNFPDGSVALDSTLTFDQASIDYQAKQAKDGRNSLRLVTLVLPLVLLLVGLAALVGAFLLYRRAGGNGHRAAPGEPAVRSGATR
ncbi:MAG: hypothetical protein QOE23_704 [Pseudonocardiales bacterium]|nr:hypothetical protein [Pseudonocardiales bacterium]